MTSGSDASSSSMRQKTYRSLDTARTSWIVCTRRVGSSPSMCRSRPAPVMGRPVSGFTLRTGFSTPNHVPPKTASFTSSQVAAPSSVHPTDASLARAKTSTSGRVRVKSLLTGMAYRRTRPGEGSWLPVRWSALIRSWVSLSKIQTRMLWRAFSSAVPGTSPSSAFVSEGVPGHSR